MTLDTVSSTSAHTLAQSASQSFIQQPRLPPAPSAANLDKGRITGPTQAKTRPPSTPLPAASQTSRRAVSRVAASPPAVRRPLIDLDPNTPRKVSTVRNRSGPTPTPGRLTESSVLDDRVASLCTARRGVAPQHELHTNPRQHDERSKLTDLPEEPFTPLAAASKRRAASPVSAGPAKRRRSTSIQQQEPIYGFAGADELAVDAESVSSAKRRRPASDPASDPSDHSMVDADNVAASSVSAEERYLPPAFGPDNDRDYDIDISSESSDDDFELTQYQQEVDAEELYDDIDNDELNEFADQVEEGVLLLEEPKEQEPSSETDLFLPDASQATYASPPACEDARRQLYRLFQGLSNLPEEVRTFMEQADIPDIAPAVYCSKLDEYIYADCSLSGDRRNEICLPTGSSNAPVLLQLNHPTFDYTRPAPGTTLDAACASTQLLLRGGINSDNTFTFDTVNRRCLIAKTKKNGKFMQAITVPKTWPTVRQKLHYDFATWLWEASPAKVVILAGNENFETFRQMYQNRMSPYYSGQHKLNVLDGRLNQGAHVKVGLFKHNQSLRKIVVFVWHPQYVNMLDPLKIADWQARVLWAYMLCGVELPADAFSRYSKSRGKQPIWPRRMPAPTTAAPVVPAAPAREFHQRQDTESLSLGTRRFQVTHVTPEHRLHLVSIEYKSLLTKVSRALHHRIRFERGEDRSERRMKEKFWILQDRVDKELEYETKTGRPTPWLFLCRSIHFHISCIQPDILDTFKKQLNPYQSAAATL